MYSTICEQLEVEESSEDAKGREGKGKQTNQARTSSIESAHESMSVKDAEGSPGTNDLRRDQFLEWGSLSLYWRAKTLNEVLVHVENNSVHSLDLSIPDQRRKRRRDTAMARSSDPLVVGRIVGDVLEEFVPCVEITAKYASRQISNGCEMKPSAVTEAPLVEIVDRNDPNALFTLIMTDPDAPSPSEPSHKEYLHWLVTDIRSGGDASAGQCIVPYESPKPPIGIHRYVFSVFRQQHPLPLNQPSTRKKFCTRLVAQQFGLGKAVAAVYFNSQKETGTRRR
ncbi:hypothetical protein R1flu_012128 [Riccia fluitans]|uniref:Uncharacterized protein n=1 Tax=Riccia fluitans TaxID=41844 RepID=A0ABD1Z9R8_9MARC